MLIGITKLEKTHKKVLEAFMKKGKIFDKCKIAENTKTYLWMSYMQFSYLSPYCLVGQVTALHVEHSQFKPSCDHWNLWFINISGMTLFKFQTWLEVEVFQLRKSYFPYKSIDWFLYECKIDLILVYITAWNNLKQPPARIYKIAVLQNFTKFARNTCHGILF